MYILGILVYSREYMVASDLDGLADYHDQVVISRSIISPYFQVSHGTIRRFEYIRSRYCGYFGRGLTRRQFIYRLMPAQP